MKKTAKILSIILALIMAIQMPLIAFASTQTVSKYTNQTYTNQTKFDGMSIVNGIDVSYYNGNIDWQKVKADGIEFAFIRVGYTGYTTSKFSLNYDVNFDKNIEGALAAGIKVGVYWYSQALTTEEAQTEAQWTLAKIGGYNITMPVVFDYEFSGASGARLKSTTLTKAQMTSNTKAFCDTVKASGYSPCVYASKSFFEDHLDYTSLESSYQVWLAHYTTSTTYAGDYDFWQYSSSGKVNGISGNTDVNFWYVKSSTSLNDEVYTGSPITPKPQVVKDNILLTENTDYTLTYANNVNIGTATITATGIGAYTGFSMNFTFKIVPQQVTGLTLTTRSKTSLTYRWDGAIAGVTGYKVYVVNNTKGTSFTKTTTTNLITLSNLTDTNEYTVRVAAYVGSTSNLGAYSDASTVHAMPGKVTGVTTSSQSPTKITIKWSKKAGADAYYIYQYSPSKKKSTKIKTVSGESTSTTITNLNSGTLYYYYVSAVAADDVTMVGAKSSKLTTGTKPKQVVLSSTKSSKSKKITVKWKIQKGSGYQIQYSTSKTFKSNTKSITFSDYKKTSRTITTTKSKKTYYVRIRGYKTINGKKYYGNWSSVKSVKTK